MRIDPVRFAVAEAGPWDMGSGAGSGGCTGGGGCMGGGANARFGGGGRGQWGQLWKMEGIEKMRRFINRSNVDVKLAVMMKC